MTNKHLVPQYSSWSEYLQNDSLFNNSLRLQSLIRIIQKYMPRGGKLLETGFGSGNTGVLLSDLGYAITLLDIEEGLFDLFQKRFPGLTKLERIKLIRGDMFHLPFEDFSFDLVYHQGVLEHLPDALIVSALQQQARVSRMVIVDVPNDKYEHHPYGDERTLSNKIWLKLIRDSCLEVIEVSGRRVPRWLYLMPHGLFLHPLVERVGLAKHFGAVSIFVCRSVLQ